jgi:hypothetical protein
MSCDLNKGQVQKKSTNKILPYDHSIEQKMVLVYTLGRIPKKWAKCILFDDRLKLLDTLFLSCYGFAEKTSTCAVRNWPIVAISY